MVFFPSLPLSLVFVRNLPPVPPSASSSSSATTPVIRSRRRKAPSTHDEEQVILPPNVDSDAVDDDIFAVPEDDDDSGCSTDEEEPSMIDSDEEEETSSEAFLPPTWNTSGYHFDPPVNDMNVTVPRTVEKYSSPIEFFHLFLPLEFVEKIVDATNLYGSAKNGEEGVPTTLEEIKRIFSVVVFMGIFRANDIHMYWSHDGKSEFISKTFPSEIDFFPCTGVLISTTVGEMYGTPFGTFVR